MSRGLGRIGLTLGAAALVILIASGSIGDALAGTSPESGAPLAIDTTLLNAYRWRAVGPDRGGWSIAVSGVRGRPKEAYFGAVGGGLWKTMDGGDTWAPVTDGQIRSASVGAVAVSEAGSRRPVHCSERRARPAQGSVLRREDR